MASHLMACQGARLVNRDELASVPTPAPTASWFPLPHLKVADTAQELLEEAGYVISKRQYALERGSHRFFGTFDTFSPLAEGVTLSVGVRSSTDKSIPLGFVAGSRVVVCSNLAFRGDLISVRRKHTLRGERDFLRRISEAVAGLGTFQEQEGQRIQLMQETELSEERADALMLRAYERSIIGARDLPRVIYQWRNPDFDEFRPRTAFSLFNAFTAALKDRATRQPQSHAAATMRLQALLSPSRN